MSIARWKTLACFLICCIFFGASRPVRADAPDYALPGEWSLPWTCGEGYRVTWDPQGHWTSGKATGLAFDLALPEGTPLYAPSDGVAYFLRDERPFDTNLGNYIEVVTGDNWLIRLAHLRDEQSGERAVQAGELLGHSGNSGAQAAHLHLEVLVREGTRWVCPNWSDLERFFGLDMAEFVENAVIANGGCPAHLLMDGNVAPQEDSILLGNEIALMVPLYNAGREALTLESLQVSLVGPDGASRPADSALGQVLAPQATTRVTVTVQPDSPGAWSVGRVTCDVGEETVTMETEGAWEVEPTSLTIVALSTPEQVAVGERIQLAASIENQGAEAARIDGLRVGGIQPNGDLWSAEALREELLQPGEVATMTLTSLTIPQQVGEWQVTRAGFIRDGQAYYTAPQDQLLTVYGPELRVEDVSVYAAPRTLCILMRVQNVGTEEAAPDALEVWGWKPDGESYFSVSNRCLRPVAPGDSVLLRWDVPTKGFDGVWRLVEGGYWTNGVYYRMTLPQQMEVGVDTFLLVDDAE
ncbi:MAG: peptidoglycan DD-metalloendopeptidase family protein [Anaerolineae bacterium]